MATLKPMPVATKISAPFWQALKENQLKIQQCKQCEGWVFFPRNHCSHCLAHELQWQQVSGEGTLYSYTLTRIPTMPEFSDEMPQALAVVELAQGVRINTTLIDVAEQDIKIGMPVKAVFDKVSSDGDTLLRFTSINNAGGVREYINPLNGLERNNKGQVQVPLSNLAALYALADNMVNYGSNRLRFPAPVPAGATIYGRSKVKDISVSHKGVQLTLEMNIHVVGNDKPSVINDLVILYR